MNGATAAVVTVVLLLAAAVVLRGPDPRRRLRRARGVRPARSQAWTPALAGAPARRTAAARRAWARHPGGADLPVRTRTPMTSARGLWASLRRFERPAASQVGATPVPVVTDLVGAALLTGLPPVVALAAVADALDTVGDPSADRLRRLDDGYATLGEALDLAARTGLGPVPLVRAASDRSRRIRAARRQVAARRLGTLVVLPTGLCLLPAFVLLTVAPLVLDLLLG